MEIAGTLRGRGVWERGTLSTIPTTTAARRHTRLMLKSLNRAIYGPTPEERVRTWQQKLKAQSRALDREIRQVFGLAGGRHTSL